MVYLRNSRCLVVKCLHDSGIDKKGSGERDVLSYDMGGSAFNVSLLWPFKVESG